MDVYKYTVYDSKGQVKKNSIPALDLEEATKKLWSKNYTIIKVKKVNYSIFNTFRIRIDTFQISSLLIHLSNMIKSGVPLIFALKILGDNKSDKKFSLFLKHIVNALLNGEQLSRAFALSSYNFKHKDFVIELLQVGELTGHLEKILFSLGKYLEKASVNRQKILSLLFYPIILCILLVLTSIFFMFNIAPNLVYLYDNLDLQLPLATRALLNTITFLGNNPYILLCLVLIPVTVINLFRQRKYLDYIFPYLLALFPGDLLRKKFYNNFCFQLSLFLSCGYPLINSLEIIRENTKPRLFRDSITSIINSLKSGSTIADSFQETGLFSTKIHDFIEIGDRSGSLDQYLKELASIYAREIDEAEKRIISLIEPVSILIIGIFIYFLMLAFLKPTFDLFPQI